VGNFYGSNFIHEHIYAYTTNRQKIAKNHAIKFNQKGRITRGIDLDDNTGEIIFIMPGTYRIILYIKTECKGTSKFAIFLKTDANPHCCNMIKESIVRTDCSCEARLIYELFLTTGTALTVRNICDNCAIIPYGTVLYPRPTFISVARVR